jgi:hypothetical protein
MARGKLEAGLVVATAAVAICMERIIGSNSCRCLSACRTGGAEPLMIGQVCREALRSCCLLLCLWLLK